MGRLLSAEATICQLVPSLLVSRITILNLKEKKTFKNCPRTGLYLAAQLACREVSKGCIHYTNLRNRYSKGWEISLSLICSSLFCSKLLILNSDCEDMARVARDSSELLSKNERFAGKNSYFCMFFTVFPLFMPKSKLIPSLFFQEQKSDSPGLGIRSFDFRANCSYFV